MLRVSSNGSAIAARDGLRDLVTPHHVDEGHVALGCRFVCLTVRRDPW